MKNTTYLILAFLVCQLSFTKVTVDPVMPALPNISVCDDNNDGMASFNLSSQDAYIISGQSSMPSSYIVTYHLTLLDANNGLNPISSTSYLGSNGQVIYARIINIATGFFAVGPFSLIVNPKPIISNKTVSICNSGTFSVTPLNILPEIVPTGTTYTWTLPVITPASSIVGGYAQTLPQTSISQTLTNPTTFNATATYIVTATTPNGCSSTFTITVSISSSFVISNKSVSICSGSTFNVTPTNVLPDVVPTGTTYTWTSPAISPSGSVIGGSANFTGQTSISQVLINSTAFPATATYTATATSNSVPNCSSVFTIVVTVNPKPSIGSITTAICSGSTFSIIPSNNPPNVVPMGTTYTWTAPVITPVGSVVGGSAQATPQTSISQMLTNYSSVNATATYTVTATSPGGCTSTFMMVVQINSRPIISNKTVSICSGSTFNVTPTNTLPDVVPVGTTYAWSAPVYSSTNISDGSAQTAPSIFVQTLTNSGNTVETATYTVTAISNAAPNSCSSVFTITVTINPSINLPVLPDVVACNSYTLPPLSNGNYFTAPNGTGIMMSAGTVITSTQMIFIHASNGVCTADESYVVIINPSIVPTFTPISPLCLNSPAPPFQLISNEGISGTWTPSIIDTTIPGNFVYTFIPDNTITGQECAVQTTVLVTVLPSINPIITGTDNSNIVYVDYPTETVVQPLLLTAMTDVPGDYTYLWYLNGSAIAGATDSTFLINYFAIPDEPRTFSVIVSSVGSGCSGMYSIVVIQAAVPAPSGLTSQTFTPGQTLADLAVIGTNVLWYSSLTGRNTTSTPLPSNTLLVDGTTYYATQTMNGYESPTRLAVTVHSTLSNDSFGFVDFKYSPNPVSDYLFIQAKETIKTVAVYNTLGQLVLSQDGNTMELKLDLSQLKSGNYFVKIQSDLKQNSFKIIKK